MECIYISIGNFPLWLAYFKLKKTDPTKSTLVVLQTHKYIPSTKCVILMPTQNDFHRHMFGGCGDYWVCKRVTVNICSFLRVPLQEPFCRLLPAVPSHTRPPSGCPLGLWGHITNEMIHISQLPGVHRNWARCLAMSQARTGPPFLLHVIWELFGSCDSPWMLPIFLTT